MCAAGKSFAQIGLDKEGGVRGQEKLSEPKLALRTLRA